MIKQLVEWKYFVYSDLIARHSGVIGILSTMKNFQVLLHRDLSFTSIILGTAKQIKFQL